MEVRNYKVGIVVLNVGRCYREHKARQPTNRKHHQESDRKQHRRLERH